VSDDVKRRKDTLEHADLKLRHEQAAGELGGLDTPSLQGGNSGYRRHEFRV
jgi:hypothetical protein